jgi:hypothetical protein
MTDSIEIHRAGSGTVNSVNQIILFLPICYPILLYPNMTTIPIIIRQV